MLYKPVVLYDVKLNVYKLFYKLVESYDSICVTVVIAPIWLFTFPSPVAVPDVLYAITESIM